MSDAPLLLVTRPREQAQAWVAQLQSLGWPARSLPLLEIGPAPEPDRIADMARQLVPGALVMFVSPNAAARALAAWPTHPLAWPAGVRAAATGPGTVAALVQAGVPADAIVAPPADAAQFDSEALWACLRHEDWRGRPVWVVRGEGGREWFSDTLRAAGAQVHWVQGYSRGAPVWSPEERALLDQALARPEAARWLFSSSEAIEHLLHLRPEAAQVGLKALATHPRIVASAQALGLRDVTLVPPGVAGLHDWLRQQG